MDRYKDPAYKSCRAEMELENGIWVPIEPIPRSPRGDVEPVIKTDFAPEPPKMIEGVLKEWRRGCWLLRDDKNQRNHYLTAESKIEVGSSDGMWRRATFEVGPGGHRIMVNGKPVRENSPARLKA